MAECSNGGLEPIPAEEPDLRTFPWNLFDNLTMVWVGIPGTGRRSKRDGALMALM
jgi:hypothetical protein